MDTFNQGWLLDSTNVNCFIGFSAVYGVVGNNDIYLKMLKKAIQLDSANTEKIIMQVTQMIMRIKNPISSFNLNGEHKEYFKTGGLKSTGNYINGIRNGRWVEYYETGVKHREYNVKNGDEDGKIVNYFENGNLCLEYYKNQGEIEGEYKVYDYDGKLVRIEFWKNSKMDQSKSKIFKEWEIDGTPAFQMKEGKLIKLIWKDGKKNLK